MRRVVVHMQSTLNGCIANAQGSFWQPFPWGDPEQAHINEVFRAADTIVLSRVLYEAIVPCWEIVAAGQVPDDVPDVSARVVTLARAELAIPETTKYPVNGSFSSPPTRRCSVWCCWFACSSRKNQ